MQKISIFLVLLSFCPFSFAEFMCPFTCQVGLRQTDSPNGKGNTLYYVAYSPSVDLKVVKHKNPPDLSDEGNVKKFELNLNAAIKKQCIENLKKHYNSIPYSRSREESNLVFALPIGNKGADSLCFFLPNGRLVDTKVIDGIEYHKSDLGIMLVEPEGVNLNYNYNYPEKRLISVGGMCINDYLSKSNKDKSRAVMNPK
jgi:hypothetical protein